MPVDPYVLNLYVDIYQLLLLALMAPLAYKLQVGACITRAPPKATGGRHTLHWIRSFFPGVPYLGSVCCCTDFFVFRRHRR